MARLLAGVHFRARACILPVSPKLETTNYSVTSGQLNNQRNFQLAGSDKYHCGYPAQISFVKPSFSFPPPGRKHFVTIGSVTKPMRTALVFLFDEERHVRNAKFNLSGHVFHPHEALV